MEKKILILGSGKVSASTIKASIQSDVEGLMLVGEAPLQTSELTEADVANLVAQRITIEEIGYSHRYERNDYKKLQKQNSQSGWKNRPRHKR